MMLFVFTEAFSVWRDFSGGWSLQLELENTNELLSMEMVEDESATNRYFSTRVAFR